MPAHPPILKAPENVRFSPEMGDRILDSLLSLEGDKRESEPFRVLRQGIEYAISVFVASLPGEGFAFLRLWARVGDGDVKRIVRANATKARLARKHVGEVERLLAML